MGAVSRNVVGCSAVFSIGANAPPRFDSDLLRRVPNGCHFKPVPEVHPRVRTPKARQFAVAGIATSRGPIVAPKLGRCRERGGAKMAGGGARKGVGFSLERGQKDSRFSGPVFPLGDT